MQTLTGPYIYGVNRRSENFLLLSDLLFARGRCTSSRYTCVGICVVLGCVFNLMMYSKVIYTGLIKTEISNWNYDGYFHRACAICEKSWWKVLKNLVEHQIIKNDKKIKQHHLSFFHTLSQDNAFSILHGPIPT